MKRISFVKFIENFKFWLKCWRNSRVFPLHFLLFRINRMLSAQQTNRNRINKRNYLHLKCVCVDLILKISYYSVIPSRYYHHGWKLRWIMRIQFTVKYGNLSIFTKKPENIGTIFHFIALQWHIENEEKKNVEKLAVKLTSFEFVINVLWLRSVVYWTEMIKMDYVLGIENKMKPQHSTRINSTLTRYCNTYHSNLLSLYTMFCYLHNIFLA